ncbi:helix-turn-helix domain-containing protein [Pseudomonas oryzihabitans]|uniref:helix-turn-helix domain-containing protein n=1 Tax=Pseudomonas oryzihabitans TaxID=47885 RepID=UPI00165E384D|nr:helix-turn-helix transcriptional regulator [Pseudomonas psychrotolerans]
MFSNDNATGKLNIRSLPHEVLAALADLAARNDRSLEAEARHALKAWVRPTESTRQESTRLGQISERLEFLARNIEKACPFKVASPSRIAEALGLTHAVPVEQWFRGHAEASFDELANIAKLMGCHSQWLIHGEGAPYSSTYVRIPEHVISGTEFLFLPNDDGLRPNLHLVRSKEETGGFLFVRQYSDWDYQVFHTPYHVSDVIGAGGEASLAALSLILKGVYRAWTQRQNSQVEVLGYLARKEVFDALMEGSSHPASILKSAERSCWWEDFWDADQYEKSNYWEGWRSITQRIGSVVNGNSRFYDQHAELASHTFDFSNRPANE